MLHVILRNVLEERAELLLRPRSEKPFTCLVRDATTAYLPNLHISNPSLRTAHVFKECDAGPDRRECTAD